MFRAPGLLYTSICILPKGELFLKKAGPAPKVRRQSSSIVYLNTCIDGGNLECRCLSYSLLLYLHGCELTQSSLSDYLSWFKSHQMGTSVNKLKRASVQFNVHAQPPYIISE